jgi:hypothetical protein
VISWRGRRAARRVCHRRHHRRPRVRVCFLDEGREANGCSIRTVV